MQCPSCKSYTLKPVKLEHGLVARECIKCQGVLIDLLSYRKWAEDSTPTPDANITPLQEVVDNSKALACPKCSRVMLKFRVTGSADNKVDVCSGCDDAWLDYGEWDLLGALAIQDKLTAIFTEPWQRNIREENRTASHEKRFVELLGNEDYKKLDDLKKWVDGHAKKSDLIRFLLR